MGRPITTETNEAPQETPGQAVLAGAEITEDTLKNVETAGDLTETDTTMIVDLTTTEDNATLNEDGLTFFEENKKDIVVEGIAVAVDILLTIIKAAKTSKNLQGNITDASGNKYKLTFEKVV